MATTTVCNDLRNGRVRRTTARNIDFLRITVRVIGSHVVCVGLGVLDEMMYSTSSLL